eukprot:scaffold5353_cov134-Isochrysis_galbana.AAC.9
MHEPPAREPPHRPPAPHPTASTWLNQPYMPSPAAAAASDALARYHAHGRRSSSHHPSPFRQVRS